MKLEHLPLLETPRLRLRQLTEGDVDALFAIFGDPEVMRYWSSPPLESRDGAAALLESIDDGRRAGRLFQWGIELRTSGSVIGTTTLYDWDRRHFRAAVGFALRRDLWRQGIVSEAVGELLRFAFEQLELHRVEADVDPENSGSVRTLEKLGFRREGHQRERYWMLGAWQDSWMYGMLRSEWDGARIVHE